MVIIIIFLGLLIAPNVSSILIAVDIVNGLMNLEFRSKEKIIDELKA